MLISFQVITLLLYANRAPTSLDISWLWVYGIFIFWYPPHYVTYSTPTPKLNWAITSSGDGDLSFFLVTLLTWTSRKRPSILIKQFSMSWKVPLFYFDLLFHPLIHTKLILKWILLMLQLYNVMCTNFLTL